jgi:hypothetical protein
MIIRHKAIPCIILGHLDLLIYYSPPLESRKGRF